MQASLYVDSHDNAHVDMDDKLFQKVDNCDNRVMSLVLGNDEWEYDLF